MGVKFQANSLSSISILCSIILMLTFFTTPSLSTDNSTSSPYDFLEEFNIPRGILPQGATNYTFDNSTSKFTINLENACTYKIKDVTLKFNPTITGIITNNSISSFEGVHLKVIIEIPITKVSIEKDLVKFKAAGIIPINIPTILYKFSLPCLNLS
ncbi:hypothetical protein Lal_00039846 [Lupinus albus]|uniref:Uncharacterized protein n=1 Tax=Lupinus albus TaxID=3870 RepID=A0A6A5NEY0_LUPAL|nr:hypothetical protein Lalb_Chr20g0115141 [Lupinus albus]KAF1881630.1 hypothetical protein Lal_00039846 [Lupinus albus]